MSSVVNRLGLNFIPCVNPRGRAAAYIHQVREAFLLQQEGDLSVEEIGAATGVSRETAKSRLRYAIAKLRASLRSGA